MGGSLGEALLAPSADAAKTLRSMSASTLPRAFETVVVLINVPVDPRFSRIRHRVMRGLTKLVPLALGAAAFGRLVRMRTGAAKATRAAKAVPPTPPVVRDPSSETFFLRLDFRCRPGGCEGVPRLERRKAARASRMRRPRGILDGAERTKLTIPHTSRSSG